MPNYDDLAQALASEGAAFGVFPQMSGRRRLQDAEAAKNIPVDILGGIVSSGLGAIPSGIKLLSDIRNAGRDDRPSAEIPGGIDYWLDKMPFKGEAPVNKAAAQLGSMLPINPAPAYRALGNVGKATTSLLGNELARGMYGNEGSLANVIPTAMKPKQIFIGENAKTWNKDAAQTAVEMEKTGAKPEDIWTATGTFRGAEGKLRQEISDKNSKITNEVFNQISSNKEFKGPISQGLTHEELYNAYPQASQIPTVMFADETPSGNILRGKEGTFQVPQLTAGGPSTIAQKSVALHELQHAVQQKEGFARGGNVNEFATGPMFDQKARDLTADLSQIVTGGVSAKPLEVLQGLKYTNPKDIEPIIKKYGFNNIDEVKSFIYDENERRTPLGQYQRLAGEAEARAVQKRRNLTDEERRATFPYQSYDVPINELIVRK